MKKLLFILFFAFTCLTDVSAQANLQSVYEIKHAFDFYLHNNSRSEQLNPTLTAHDIKGSPYLSDEFIEGTIYTTSKTKFMDVPIRYNIYNDQVEFRNADDQIFAISAPEVIEKIEIQEFCFEYVTIQASKKISRGYLVVLEKGDASLYCKQKVILEQAKQAAAYSEAQPPQFVRKSDEYYIQIGTNAAKPVSKKKDLQNIFTAKRKEIDAFIKTNKTKPNNAKSLRELVIYYNSL